MMVPESTPVRFTGSSKVEATFHPGTGPAAPATYASRTSSRVADCPPEVQAAVEAIKRRLSWPSLHWGAEDLHPDALPHIAAAVLDAQVLPLVGTAQIQREAGAKALRDAAFDLDIPNTKPHTREDSIGAAGAPDWLRDRAAALLRRDGGA